MAEGNLVLSRREGEAVILYTDHGEIRIECSSRTRLSINAPRDIRIVREELLKSPPRVKSDGR